MRLLKRPAKSAFKRLILTTPLCQHLLLSMSSTLTPVELSDADCEKGQVTQRPPIAYALSKSGTALSATRETIKMKTPEGESKQTLLSDGADGEEYVKHLMSFFRYMEKLGYEADLEAAASVTLIAYQALKKAGKVPPGEKDPAKAIRLAKVEAAKIELEKAKIAESTFAGPAYDLFRKLLRDDPETQWDRIVSEMHTKSPWEDLTGVKRNSLRMKSQLSLIECIEFHKLTFFSVDAVERLKYYMMYSVKKPIKSTIRMHVTWMETLNKYVGMLPTIKNSPLAVASMEYGNIPFTEATHASIILSHLPVAWRHQYDLTHKTVLESPRAMLQDLEYIEKLFVERYNEKARANKAKATTAPKSGEHVPRKGKSEVGPLKGTPKKGHSAKFCKWCKWCKGADGPFTTHDTIKCRRFGKDGSPKEKPTKPFESDSDSDSD